MFRKHLVAFFAIAVCVIPCAAFAQTAYPTKPIKIIAPVQPGGGVDLVARQVGDGLSKALGQPVVVENQRGAAASSGRRPPPAPHRTAIRSW
jgi:tripartite-type tricarboxylate transporter receptor subunit TctC